MKITIEATEIDSVIDMDRAIEEYRAKLAKAFEQKANEDYERLLFMGRNDQGNWLHALPTH